MSSKWYLDKGAENDIILSTRIRLARNLSGFPFPNRIDPQTQTDINRRVRDAVISGNSVIAGEFTYFELNTMPPAERGALLEHHLISPELAGAGEGKALLLSADHAVSIMLGEEDHVRIQVLSSGENLRQAYELAEKIDSLLDHELHFAFDDRLGYLTECPTNLGTGLRASLMLHLPAIESLGAMGQLISSVSKIGLTIRGTFGEGTRVKGSLYQLSNQVTLGISEENAIENLKSIAGQIIAQERSLREKFNMDELSDKVYRSLGILQNARLLTSDEMMDLLSNVRLGVSMNIISGIDLAKINQLQNEAGSATLTQAAHETLDAPARDKRRSEIARDIMKPQKG